MARRTNTESNNGATLGFEEKLWHGADELRNNMHPAEYKHIALGLLSLHPSLMHRMGHESEENGFLSAIRDTLLPRLLSGEIRVRDAEMFVEDRI